MYCVLTHSTTYISFLFFILQIVFVGLETENTADTSSGSSTSDRSRISKNNEEQNTFVVHNTTNQAGETEQEETG